MDVDVNMAADCRLGGLITPLFVKSSPKAIEVFTEITLIRVDGEGAVEADGPVDRLIVALEDSPSWINEGVVAGVTLCVSVVEADGPVHRLIVELDDSPSWLDEGAVAGVTHCISVVEVWATATGWLAIWLASTTTPATAGVDVDVAGVELSTTGAIGSAILVVDWLVTGLL